VFFFLLFLLFSFPGRGGGGGPPIAQNKVEAYANASRLTLIKKKIKLSSYIRNSEWSSCKVIYEEGLPNI
jgi:hypothetical protein